MKKRIAILGSTGSIGKQALQVIDQHPSKFEVEVLVANNNVELLIEQSVKYIPNAVVIANKDKYAILKESLIHLPIKIFAGYEAIDQIVQMESIDMVLTAMVGFAGLQPTIKALESRKHIALANKETLVVAGDLITRLAQQNNLNIFPVDSEHSAIFQCLTGEIFNPIEKIFLTASGGPFRGKSIEFLRDVTIEQALKHPNWKMGHKITIDSASLMNKGLEAIEAKWLFNLQPDQIDIVVHPQSIIHSIVQFEDGSMKAQMGLPDMRLPIQYALSYPERLKSDFPRFNFMDFPSLTFEKADTKVFQNLELAFFAMNKGGNMPCIMNAANEIAVEAFLKSEISFVDMSQVISETMNTSTFIDHPSFDDYILSDEESRRKATHVIKHLTN